MKKPRLIHYHDSRHLSFYRFDPPMSLYRLRQPVDELIGTPVDTLSYGLGMGQTFLYDSHVGTKFGENAVEHNSGLVWWRAAENFKLALEAGYDPLKVVVDRAHEKGIQVLGSLRINDGGSPEIGSNYSVGRLKYENPEVMIGEEDPDSPHVATCLDFARQDVREERLAVIEEVCDRYGADGIEIDQYVRAFFKPSEVRQNTPLLTEFMRSVRETLGPHRRQARRAPVRGRARAPFGGVEPGCRHGRQDVAVREARRHSGPIPDQQPARHESHNGLVRGRCPRGRRLGISADRPGIPI